MPKWLHDIFKDAAYVVAALQRQFNLLTSLKLTAIPAIAALSSKIWGWQWNTVHYAVVFFIMAAVALLFVVARRARILEEPKVEATVTLWGVTMNERAVRARTFAIQLENKSCLRIDNVECVVSRLVSAAHGRYSPIHRHVQFIDSNGAVSTSLNPHAKKHAVLFEYADDDTEQHAIVIAGNTYRVEPGQMTIEVEISAANAPAEVRRCIVDVHENGEMKAVGLKLDLLDSRR